MLQDNFGRRFHYLRLSVTDVCNFHCNYCLPDGYQCHANRDFLALDEITTVCHAFAASGTSKIRITGGEPSLRKDLADIIAICAATPGIETVALTTNGFRLEQQVERWCEAGLTALNVSIDSLDPRLFTSITGHNKLHTILKGLDKAQKLGLKVKVNTVLLRQFNSAELQTFVDWLRHTSVTLRLIELMQTGDNQGFFANNHVSALPIQQQFLAQGWQPLLKAKNAGPAVEYYHADYAGRLGFIMPYSKDFCACCNRLRISATGKLHLCLFAQQGLDLRPLLKQGNSLALQQKLQLLLAGKESSHHLQQGMTGATSHLAMLGG